MLELLAGKVLLSLGQCRAFALCLQTASHTVVMLSILRHTVRDTKQKKLGETHET